MKSYGISSFAVKDSELDYHIENIKRRGYSVIKNHISLKKCDEYSTRIEEIYEKQKNAFGQENLKKIKEVDSARMLFAYDSKFLELITDIKILKFISAILGENYILQLQNGVINRPNKEHHQTSWHRDIPYQEYTLSNPIAINVFYCLTPFNKETGGTVLLPYSHLFPKAPSIKFLEENSIQPDLNPGDVILFDSWLYHKAGNNSSNDTRYGVNNLFTSPILKQQVNIPKMLGRKYEENPILRKILGYDFEVPNDVNEYRNRKLQKL
jgi:ectoine hydroxylase-related dioxygenase (phytanoyl-CoA dioxygenase family)